MKAVVNISLNRADMMQVFNSIPLNQCQEAINILQTRLDNAKDIKLVKGIVGKQRKQLLLSKTLDELPLTQRTRKQLKKRGIVTVQDVTDIGLDKLMMFSRIGKATVNDLRKAIFGVEN